MKEIRRYFTAVLLLFVLTVAAYAGQMDTTIVPPPTTPGQMDTTVAPPATPGQMDTTISTDATTNTTNAVESLTELALNACQSLLL